MKGADARFSASTTLFLRAGADRSDDATGARFTKVVQPRRFSPLTLCFTVENLCANVRGSWTSRTVISASSRVSARPRAWAVLQSCGRERDTVLLFAARASN